MGSSNVSTAGPPAALVIEEEENKPVTLYFSYTKVNEPDIVTAAENEDTDIPAFNEEAPDISLEVRETLPETIVLETKSAEQTNPDITEQADGKDAAQKPESTPAQLIEKFTDAEKEMIAKVVYAESRGECFDGQVAVAQVVINRYVSGKYGATLKRVVYARCQFAVSRRFSAPCLKAVEYAIKNMPYPKDMYYFRVSKSKHWRNFDYYNRIGNHSFYCGKK